jgi:hypothetical protein
MPSHCSRQGHWRFAGPVYDRDGVGGIRGGRDRHAQVAADRFRETGVRDVLPDGKLVATSQRRPAKARSRRFRRARAGIKGRRRGTPLEPLGRSPLLRLGKSHDGILHRAHSGARGWNASRSVCRRSSRRPAGDVRVRRSIDDSRFLAPRPTSALSDIGALLLIEQWAEAHVRK